MEVSFLSSIGFGAGVWAPTSPALANTNATPTTAASALFTVTPPECVLAVRFEGPGGPSPYPLTILQPVANACNRGRAHVDPGLGSVVKMTRLPHLWRIKAVSSRQLSASRFSSARASSHPVPPSRFPRLPPIAASRTPLLPP